MVDSIYTILGIAIYWFFLGITGGAVLQWQARYLKVFFLLSTLGSVFLLIISSLSLHASPANTVISMGIPGYPFHLHSDPFSAFFLMLLSVATLGISIFSSDYFRHLTPRIQSMICLNYHLFLASMTWILIAADAY